MPSADITFAADHPVAAGHFPGNPIIPGALLLDEILCVLGGPAGGPLVIKSAKFFRPLRPGETVRVEWRDLAGGVQKFECRLSGADALVAVGTIETGDAA
jgi:3-hydroxymyristoyl/3-hydroxydecanoyl-(acyl carrier protein) dehydratase